MLKRKNKIIVFLSSLLVLIIFCAFQVYAAGKVSLRAPYIIYNGSKVTYQTNNMAKPYEMGLLLMNGQTTYCIEPKVSIPPKGHRNDYIVSLNTGLDNDVVRKIQLASFYGYDYPNHKNHDFYLAAQQMIWKYLGYGDVVYRDEKGNRIDVSNEINTINALINDHDKKPSFDGETIYMKKGDNILKEDTNKLLTGFKVTYVSSPFVEAVINPSNILSITVFNNNSTPNKATIKLVKESSQGGTPQVYSSKKYQKTIGFSVSGGSDGSSLNIESYINLVIEGGIEVPENCEDDNKDNKSQCHSFSKFHKGPCIDDETLSSDYYNVKCSENLTYGADFEKSINITAGEGFDYNINISGERTCKGTFNVDAWITAWNDANIIIEDEHKTYVEKYNATIGAGGCPTTRKETDYGCKGGTPDPITHVEPCNWGITGHTTYCNNPDMEQADYLDLKTEMEDAKTKRDDAVIEKKRLSNIKSAFELWTNNYKLNSDVKISIQEGNTNKNITMIEDILDSKNNHNDNRSSYIPSKTIYNCTFSGESDANCEWENIPIYANWERYSYVKAIYKLPHKYIEKDSDATIKNSNCPNCIDGGYKYYTNFDTPTGEYNIKVTASNLGHKGKWSVTDTCSYELNNLVKPPSGGKEPDGDKDPNYEKTFLYRPISLFDPFPNRVAGPNWRGRENLITDNASTIYNKTPEYVVDLTPQDIQLIKKNNALMKNKNISNVYTEYKNNSKDADPKKPYKSHFIHTEFKKIFGGSAK